MTRLQLVVVEALIVVIGVSILAVVIVWPFGDQEGSASANPQSTDTVDVLLSEGRPSPSASPMPTPKSDGCAPSADRSFLSGNTIVSYYGNPYAETLGILGKHEPAELVPMLSEQARQIDELNGIRGVQPAFHLVWATAQPEPGDDGNYVSHVDAETTEEYIDIACENGFLVFLDLQNGRSDPVEELRRIEPYLLKTNVHVAIDPEFTMGEGQTPGGESLGHVDAAQVNAVQAELERIVKENNLPNKIMIVHQFDERMIHDPESIQSYPSVHVVIDMDGFGTPEVKIKKYGIFAQPAEHGGIKVFFEQDTPRLTDEQIVELDPEVIIYQ